MSDQPPRTRRSGPLIVPVVPADTRHASSRDQNDFKPLPPRPTVRARAYGAPLIGAKRTAGPVLLPEIDSANNVPEVRPQEHAETVASVTAPHLPASTTLGRVQTTVVPLVFWDQPPRPESAIDESDMLPTWASDVTVSPTEQQYLELGTYLLFMVDGFSNFCCAAPVLESGQWQGRMRMPPKILPETMLQLEVSVFSAKLRFETEHPVSREILRRHCEALQHQISMALDDSREVEVSIW